MPLLKESWLFPVIQSVHLIGIALWVGGIVLADLRALGLKIPLIPQSRFWFLVVLITGPLMFAADVPRYTQNPAFIVKMVILAAALIVHSQRQGKAGAIASLTLWSLVVLAGRAIADFDI